MPTTVTAAHSVRGAHSSFAGDATIEILNAGGTLSASDQASGERNHIALAASNDDRFRIAFESMVDEYLKQSFGATRLVHRGSRPVTWRWIESERLLSENARPSDWIHIINRVRDRLLEPGPLPKGIVVIHGTDTMDHVVPAAHLALWDCPVPVVFVGSNYPMLQDQPAGEKPLAQLTSDAWQNLLNALVFCMLAAVPESIVARRGVFLSFGNCIHYPLNLRKVQRSAGDVGADFLEHRRMLGRMLPEEPYLFQNLLSKGRFRYRTVHGHFVSNAPFQPPRASPSDLDAWWRRSARGSDSTQVDRCVASLGASPATLSFDMDARKGQLPLAHIIETYGSGTFPSREGHPFREVIETCSDHGIPVFLAGNYGIDPAQRYAMDFKREIVAYRVNNLIPETLVPLVHRACLECGVNELEQLAGWDRGEALRTRMLEIIAGAERLDPQFEQETHIIR